MNVARPEQDYFSVGFRTFITTVYPYGGRPAAVFPSGCHGTRISSSDTIHEWFKRVIDESCYGSVDSCSLEDNIAVFAHLAYSGALITYINIQVVIADVDVETFYLDPNSRCSYFRLDYDLGTLGEMFKEPQPHVHTSPNGPPRFVHNVLGGNVVVDFFDMIYRNYLYDKWLEWARTACSKIGRIEDFDSGPDALDPILSAFRAGQHQVLMLRYRDHLQRIKRACRQLKDSIFPARANGEVANVLSYEV